MNYTPSPTGNDAPALRKTMLPFSEWVARSRLILGPLIAMGRVRSVLDLGCNCGPWLGAANDLGAVDVQGVNDQNLWDNILFDRSRFLQHDLSQPLRLGRRFDLVICVEVAEHIPGGDVGAWNLMQTIAAHGDTVLFSAATPGTPGDGHVNCQPHTYWHERFAALGYQCHDVLRPLIGGIDSVEWWYKSNMFLYTR